MKYNCTLQRGDLPLKIERQIDLWPPSKQIASRTCGPRPEAMDMASLGAIAGHYFKCTGAHDAFAEHYSNHPQWWSIYIPRHGGEGKGLSFPEANWPTHWHATIPFRTWRNPARIGGQCVWKPPLRQHLHHHHHHRPSFRSRDSLIFSLVCPHHANMPQDHVTSKFRFLDMDKCGKLGNVSSQN